MDFVTLDGALDAIAERIAVSALIAADGPDFIEAWIYSEAAATLRQHFLNSPESRPRWVEIDETELPIFNEAAASEGIEVLKRMAGWHRRMIKQRTDHIISCESAGLDPETEPQSFDMNGGKYERTKFFRGRELGFERGELAHFYKACQIDHVLVAPILAPGEEGVAVSTSQGFDVPKTATLTEACAWLETQGIKRIPRNLIEAGDEERLTLYTGVPEGAHTFELDGSTLRLRRFAKGEMAQLSPEDCRQFLSTGEANVYGRGLGPSSVEKFLAQIGGGVACDDPFGDLSITVVVKHESALRVKGEDLDEYANHTPKPIGLIAKDAARREHPPVLGDSDVRRDVRNAMRQVAERDFLTRLVEYVRMGKLRAINPFNGAPYDPALPHLDPSDPMWSLDGEQREVALGLLGQLAREDGAGYGSVSLQSAKSQAVEAEEKRERQSRGFYTLREAAQVVADAEGLNKANLLKQLCDECLKGKLRARDPSTGAPIRVRHPRAHPVDASTLRDFHHLVTRADLDELFIAWGVIYRFPTQQVAESAKATDTIDGNESRLPDSNSGTSIVHRLKGPRHVLDPIIDKILETTGRPIDPAVVWNELVGLADVKDPPPPLLGFIDGKGVQYTHPKGVRQLNRKALGQRLTRRT